MREELERNLASKIEPSVVADILSAYEGLIQKHRALDAEAALTRAGKFVEHIFRALEFIRAGTAPAEIKSPAATAKLLENDTTLPESIRMLVPRIALGMIYDVRSMGRSVPPGIPSAFSRSAGFVSIAGGLSVTYRQPMIATR